MKQDVFKQIYAIVREIPLGKVATYGLIARLAGNPRWPRVVGYAMSACRDPAVPCHRVVNRFGGLSDAFTPMGKETHRFLLETEGVGFLSDGCVDLAHFLWDGTDAGWEEREI